MSLNQSINASSNNAFTRPRSDPMSLSNHTTNSKFVQSAHVVQSTFPGCCICRAIDDENLLHCRGCSINVHPLCAGIPHTTNWRCRKCEILVSNPAINPADIACFACGTRTGYLSPTDDGRWVDLMCGTWFQGLPGPSWTASENSATAQLNDVNLIERSLFGQTCYICQSNFGCCFRCSYAGCSKYFHPTCGQRAGLTLQLEPRDDDDDYQYPHAYCSVHSRPVDRVEEHRESSDEPAQSSSTDQTNHQVPHPSSQKQPPFSTSLQRSKSPYVDRSKHSDLSFSPSKRSSPFSSTLPVIPTSHASYRSRSGNAFPDQSPDSSPIASPSMSSATSPAHHQHSLPVIVEPDVALVDHFTDKRTFHNLIETYMRPIAAVDLLRLGQLFPPPSKRLVARSQERRKAKQKEPAHIHPARQSSVSSTSLASTSQSSTSQLQQTLESPHTSPRIDAVDAAKQIAQLEQANTRLNLDRSALQFPHPPRIPFVPFERDPSLLIPYRGLGDLTWSTLPNGEMEVPHMPNIHDLPHISALMGTDISVCNLQSMSAERVSTAPAVVVKPQGAFIIDETDPVCVNDDAWSFHPTGQRSVYPYLAPGDVIKPVPNRPLDFLHCDASAVLERSSSPTTRIHVLLSTTDGLEEFGHPSTTRSSLIEYRGVWNENWQDEDQPLFKDAELQGFTLVDADGFKDEIQRAQLPPLEPNTPPRASANHCLATDHPPPDQDELLRELINCQQELMREVQANVVRRAAISSNISWQDFIDYQTELAVHEEKSIGCYNSAVAWHTFRHSMASGMKDAVIPKHVLIAQVAQAKREAKGRTFIEPAAVTPYKSQLPESSSLAAVTSAAETTSSSSDNDFDEFVTCCVCFDNTSSDTNPILYCDRCSLTVHRVCFGVATLPENDWYCQYCEYQRAQSKASKRKSGIASLIHSHSTSSFANEATTSPMAPSIVYPCALCPYRGGALKPTNDKRWCHILCALLVSGTRLQDLARLEPIWGVDDALQNQAKHGATCCVCRIDWGACVFCVHPGCGLAFHSYCGWLQGFYYEAELQGINIKFVTYCPQHTPDKALSEVKVAQLNFAATPAASPQTSPHVHSGELYDPSALMRSSVADSRLDVEQITHDPNSWIPTSAADFIVATPFQPITSNQIPPGTPFFARQESSMSTMSISASTPSLPLPPAYPRHVLINLRLFQQRDIRNRAREDRRPKDTKKKRRRIEKRRLERSRALHEDLYPIGKCAVCFMSDEQLQQQIQFNADSHVLPERKRINKSTWTEIITPAPSSAYPNNRLLRCDQCGVEVHQLCYGVTDQALEAMQARRAAVVAEKGDPLDDELMSTGFNCMRCAHQCRDVKCELCPRKGGALKPIVDPNSSSRSQGWIHTVCALWFEELKFKDPVTLSGVEGINSISKMKRRMRCGLCKRGGLCLPCSEPNCDEALHPMCGMFAGVFMQLYARADAEHKPSKRLIYCPRHTPVPLARFIAIPHSFALMTTLRRELDVARLLLDTIRRREKIKQALLSTEFEIQQATWEQTLQQCRETRLSQAAVAAAPSRTKENVIKFKISRASNIREVSHVTEDKPSIVLKPAVEPIQPIVQPPIEPVINGHDTERRSSRRSSHQEPSPQLTIQEADQLIIQPSPHLTPVPITRRKRHSIDHVTDQSPHPKRARHETDVETSSLPSLAAPDSDQSDTQSTDLPASQSSAHSADASSDVSDVETSIVTAPRKRGRKPRSGKGLSTPSGEPRKRGRPKSAATKAREALVANGGQHEAGSALNNGRGRKKKK